MPGPRPSSRRDPTRLEYAVVRSSHRLAVLFALATVAGCGQAGDTLSDNYDATVQLTLTGTGAARLVTSTSVSSDASPDVIGQMTCTLAEGTCERSEDLDDDIRSPESIELRVIAEPDSGTAFLGWSGDCIDAGLEEALIIIREERTFTCSAAFRSKSSVVRIQDDFSSDMSAWAVMPFGTFNGHTELFPTTQGNPGRFLLIQQSMGEWLYAFKADEGYEPTLLSTIDSIVYQEDRKIFFPAADVSTASVGAVFAISYVNDPTIYVARLPDDVNGQFQTREWQTRRAVFRTTDFTPQLDVSPFRGPMVFGLGRRDEWRTGTLIQYGTDNFSVTVYYH